jgi:hypothetical protein
VDRNLKTWFIFGSIFEDLVQIWSKFEDLVHTWVEIRYWKCKWCYIWGLGFVCISDSRHSGQYISNMISIRPANSSLFLYTSQRTLFILGIEPNVEPRAESSVGRYWKVDWQGHLHVHCGGTRLLEMRRAKCRTSQSYRDSAGWCRRDVCTCLWSIQIHGGGGKKAPTSP